MQLRKFSEWWRFAGVFPVSALFLAISFPVLLAEEETAPTPAPTAEGVTGEASSDAEEPAGESSDPPAAEAGKEVEAEPVGESGYAPVTEALVAIRGDRQSGIGTLVEIDGEVFVLTALSAFAKNSRMALRTATGETIPVDGVAGARNSDLAMLKVAGDTSELPVAGSLFDAPLESGTSLTIQTPHDELEASGGSVEGGRAAAPETRSFVFAGTPVVLDGKVVGVFSPARNVFAGSGDEPPPTEGEVWQDGMVFLSSDLRWQPINPIRMAAQARTLAGVAAQVQQLGAFLGVGSLGFSEVSVQPLLSAKSRLYDGILDSRDKTATDLKRVRDRFVFSVTSFSSDIAPTLIAAGRDYYGYFQPEVAVLKNLYRPVWEKLSELKESPSKADGYAR